MPLTNRCPGSQSRDKEVAETGTVEREIDGTTYSGSYAVHSVGVGKRRYRVAPDNGVTVRYQGDERHAQVGSGLESTAETLLLELVTANPKP